MQCTLQVVLGIRTVASFNAEKQFYADYSELVVAAVVVALVVVLALVVVVALRGLLGAGRPLYW